MSSNFNFHANQCDKAYKPTRLGNWEIPNPESQQGRRPQKRNGFSRVVANDRGHLLPKVGRKDNAWGNFVGTWDMPHEMPAFSTARPVNPQGRQPWSVMKAEKAQARAEAVLSGGLKQCGKEPKVAKDRADQAGSIKEYVSRYKRMRQLVEDDEESEKDRK